MRQDLVVGVPHFSKAERELRWARVRAAMRAEGVDAIFAPPNTGLWDQFQANVRYLTGIGVNCCQAAAVFPLEGEVTAITSPDVHPDYWLGRQNWVTDIRPVSAGWGYAGAAIERLRELGLENGRIGITGLEGNTRFPEGITSHGIVSRIKAAFPNAEIVNANLLMDKVRLAKSEEELGFISKANELVGEAIAVLVKEAKPGVPENMVYARMMASMVEAGGELPTMILWSAGWPQPPSNQYWPSQRPLRTGDCIMIEAEARWGGYIAQNTQPLFMGPAPKIYHEMFKIQQEAIQLCYDALRAGNTVADVVAAAAKTSAGAFDCSLIMHARGLGDDSPMTIYAPRDATMAEWVLEEGGTFIVKPLIKTKDNAHRIYWGDMVKVTRDGAQRLGTRPPEIVEIGC